MRLADTPVESGRSSAFGRLTMPVETTDFRSFSFVFNELVEVDRGMSDGVCVDTFLVDRSSIGELDLARCFERDDPREDTCSSSLDRRDKLSEDEPRLDARCRLKG